MPRLRLIAVSAVVLSAALPAGAQGSRTQLSVFQDDEQLVLSGAAARERTLDDLQRLGADTVHSIVFWHKVAPAPLSTKRPSFNGADPATYPPELWDGYDDLVRGAVARGLDLMLSPSSPMPAWASECAGSRKLRKTCRPNLTQFKRFVQALGVRYSGEYKDENQSKATLPRVARWSIWNEPNQGGWLQPQYARGVAVSPQIYRELVRAAIKGLRASGHSDDDILLGETAPIGRVSGPASTRPIPPGQFLRGVFCLDARGRGLRGAAAAALGCAGYRKLAVTGISHHPYTRGGSQPPTSKGNASEITIASIGRLKSLLRQASRRGRIPGGLPIYYTEYGFQTNPPDTNFGVSLTQQAAYLNQSDWMVYRDRQVRSVAQYELRDEPALSAFQTGLRFVDGRPKPSFEAYRFPIWVTKSGASLRVWGQLRPIDDGEVEDVVVEGSADGQSFTTLEIVRTTNRKGFVEASVSPGANRYWRLRWTPKDGGATITSRVAGIGR
ncbi:MAG TPA: hypothetical protein VFZ89_15195 [Solirubrobacteraceae bacterium]